MNAAGGIRTRTVETLSLVPPADWATAAAVGRAALRASLSAANERAQPRWPGRESNPQHSEFESGASAMLGYPAAFAWMARVGVEPTLPAF